MIIAEIGTGLANANSYTSIGDADAVHYVRQNKVWAETIPDDRERALILATDYIDQHYRAHGEPLTVDQALQWPRTGQTAVPRAIRNATAILALYALNGPLIAPAQRGIKSLKKTVGKLSTETVYDDPANSSDPYPEITGMISDVASTRGQGAQVWFTKVIR